MPFWSHILLGGAAATQVIFIVGAATVFDVRTLEWKSRVFAVAFVVAVSSTIGFQGVYPRQELAAQLLSAILLMTSHGLFFWAAAVNKQKKLTAVHSSDVPKHLMTSGPYAYIRHPFYSAYITAFIASAVASKHLIPLACAVLCCLHYYCAAKLEERKFSQSILGSEYAKYRAHTGMFFPRLWSR